MSRSDFIEGFPSVLPTEENEYAPEAPWGKPTERVAWVDENLHRFLFPVERICEEAVEYTYRGDNMGPCNSGIYFLQWGGQIVYVGMATDICARLAAHRKSKKQWTHFWCFVGVPREILRQVEYVYLKWLNPPLNRPDNKGWSERGRELVNSLEPVGGPKNATSDE